jgi:hypothetical protein
VAAIALRALRGSCTCPPSENVAGQKLSELADRDRIRDGRLCWLGELEEVSEPALEVAGLRDALASSGP